MIWFLIIVGLLIFAPMYLLMAGVGIVAIAIPFLVFFTVWIMVSTLFLAIFPQATFIGIALGFCSGIVAARTLVKRFLA